MKLPVLIGEMHQLTVGKSDISFKLIEEQVILLISPKFGKFNKNNLNGRDLYE